MSRPSPSRGKAGQSTVLKKLSTIVGSWSRSTAQEGDVKGGHVDRAHGASALSASCLCHEFVSLRVTVAGTAEHAEG